MTTNTLFALTLCIIAILSFWVPVPNVNMELLKMIASALIGAVSAVGVQSVIKKTTGKVEQK